MSSKSRKIIISTGIDTKKDLEISSPSPVMSNSSSEEISSLFMSMISHRSNTTEYKLASFSLHKILVSLIDKNESTFLCPHSDWFGYDEDLDVRVTSFVCRFCGIKENCSRYKNKKEIIFTVHTLFKEDKIPSKRVLENFFSYHDPMIVFQSEF